jgi:hypothetical protein
MFDIFNLLYHQTFIDDLTSMVPKYKYNANIIHSIILPLVDENCANIIMSYIPPKIKKTYQNGLNICECEEVDEKEYYKKYPSGRIHDNISTALAAVIENAAAASAASAAAV